MSDPFDSPRPVLGPWFTASHDGDCAGCLGGIEAGERIRADSEDGYLCTDCGEDWA